MPKKNNNIKIKKFKKNKKKKFYAFSQIPIRT